MKVRFIPLSKVRRRDGLLFTFFSVLNMFDAYATLYGISKGEVVEINPLMQALIEHGTTTFLLVKILGASILGIVLLMIDFPKKFNSALLFVSGMYAMLSIYHMLILWHIGF